ncbi:MAG: hypothetical protein ACE5II_00535 [Anaerolineae bacterium]
MSGAAMEKHRVVVLYCRSLLAAGVARLLKERRDVESLDLDAQYRDATEGLKAFRPEVIVLDRRDTDLSRQVGISDLLAANPGVKIITLDPYSNEIGVISAGAQRRVAGTVRSLMREIREAQGETPNAAGS